MPGGRVQPVILSKLVDAQLQKKLNNERVAQLEEQRLRTIAAQQQMHLVAEAHRAEETHKQGLNAEKKREQEAYARAQLEESEKNAKIEEERRSARSPEQVIYEDAEHQAALTQSAAEQQRSEKEKHDEEALRVRLEAKLAEQSAPSDLKSQQDADDDLRRWQMAGLDAEKKRDTDAQRIVAESVSTANNAECINTDAELAAIRARINDILMSDAVV